MALIRRGAAAILALVAGYAVAADEPQTKPAQSVTLVPLTAAKPAKAGDPVPVVPANPLEKREATHKVSKSIEVKGFNSTGGQNATLQTICLNTDGNVVGLVALMKPYGAPIKGATAQVHLFDSSGKPIKDWKVDFHGQSVNCGPDGTIYVAGDGKLAKFDKSGKPIGTTIELPHVAALLKDSEKLRKKAEEQLKREQESFGRSIEAAKKQFGEKVKELETKKAEDLTKTEARQLDQYKKLLEQYAQMEKEYKGRTVDQVLADMTGRVRVINGVAASDKDVFVACGDTEGYGYAIWRLSADMKDAKQVLGGIGGCCGQMDIQCHGPDVLVAENTKHQFGRYDREGKKIGAFGKRGLDTDPACFGGCCNPMNVRACGVGDIYTAESEGVIKRFSPSGEFLETAGVVKLTGGCKNVAVAVSNDAKKIYFCDLPGSKFHILEKNSDK
jgi:hypothetical protein